jgi:hypothetical protein
MVKEFFLKIGLKPSNADFNLFNNILVIERRQDVDIVKAKVLAEWKGKDLGPALTFVDF